MQTLHNLVHAMQSHGLNINSQKLVFNKIGRCGTQNKPNSKNAWYIAFDNDTFSSAVFGNFQTGTRQTWCSKCKLSFQERNQQKVNYAQAQKQLEQIKQEQLRQLRNQYQQYRTITNDMSHGYLDKKGVKQWLRCSQAERLKLDRVGNLIMPIRNVNNELMGYQIINSDSDKWFATGTQKKGNFYLLIADGLKLSDCHYIYIGEGLATMISWYIAMNEYLPDDHFNCVVALDVGNIEPVLLNIWSKYKNIPVTIIADNDCNSVINIGVTTANTIKNKYQHQYKIDVFVPELNCKGVAC